MSKKYGTWSDCLLDDGRVQRTVHFYLRAGKHIVYADGYNYVANNETAIRVSWALGSVCAEEHTVELMPYDRTSVGYNAVFIVERSQYMAKVKFIRDHVATAEMFAVANDGLPTAVRHTLRSWARPLLVGACAAALLLYLALAQET